MNAATDSSGAVHPLIDLHAFVNDIVDAASVPSITLRVLLGAVIVWLIPPRRTPARLSANAPATG